MDDLISRQVAWKEINMPDRMISLNAAIDALEQRKGEDSKRNACIQGDIDALQGLSHTLDVQPWIPCTPDTMPKDDTEVIVSCTDDSGDYEVSYTAVGWHYEGLWVVDNERCLCVRAWKPMPRPWEGE